MQILSAVLALLLLAWLLQGVDVHELAGTARRMPAVTWALALAGVLATYGLRAARLHAEWRARTDARFVDCLALFAWHNAAVSLLPLRTGEAGYAWWLHRHWQVPLAQSLPSLLWLRLQDAAVLGTMVLALLVSPALAFVAVAALALLAAVVLRGGRGGPVGGMTEADRAPWLPRLLQGLYGGRGGWRSWAFCAANWGVKLGISALLLQAAGLHPAALGWCGAAGAEAGAALPLQAPAGLGVFEAGALAGVHLCAAGAAPVDAGAVVGAALLVHALWLLVSVGAALVVLAARRSFARPARALP
ncbi:lysylphosphatidylglycerol synthase domain-containing protein [uncultured Pseudacidovorax sp.]|nr:lysylphosphatidylglycerol synthase domain-containing protein [uncultured Pseudacidovorax sp.]